MQTCESSPGAVQVTEHLGTFSVRHASGKLSSRRLLFLTFAFPPSRAIGAVRAWCLAKYLAQMGWMVTVVTIDPRLLTDPNPDFNVEAACDKYGIRRILTDCGWRMLLGGSLRLRWWERPRLLGGLLRRLASKCSVESTFGWEKAVLQSCDTATVAETDVIFASAPAFGGFRLAAALARKLGVPYVMDYRDLWSLSPHASRPVPKRIVSRERRLLSNAAGVWVVSPSMAAAQRNFFNLSRAPQVITNGFDLDEVASVEPMRSSDFALVYAGSFYPPDRVIDPVIAAAKRANELSPSQTRPVRLHYYGPSTAEVDRVASAFKAREWVVTHSTVPRNKVLSALKGAGAAVVITSVRPHADLAHNGILTGKVFEALALKVPILQVAPPGSDGIQVVDGTGSGRTFTGTDVEGMARWLARLRNEEVTIQPRGVEAYSWQQIATRADQALRGVLLGAEFQRAAAQ